MAECKKRPEDGQVVFETKDEQTWRAIQEKILSAVPLVRRAVVEEDSNIVAKKLKVAHWQRTAQDKTEFEHTSLAMATAIANSQ